MREKLRRMSVIVYLLKIKKYSYSELTNKVNRIMDSEYHRSSIEKDVSMLREEFDCPIESTGRGLKIDEEYDFIESVKIWVDFYL